jgi:hypothetical protein
MTWHVVCPHCGTELDGSLITTGDHPPDPGDVTICVACHRLSLFDQHGHLRPPTPAETRALNRRPDVRRAVAMLYQHEADEADEADDDEADEDDEATGR